MTVVLYRSDNPELFDRIWERYLCSTDSQTIFGKVESWFLKETGYTMSKIEYRREMLYHIEFPSVEEMIAFKLAWL